MAVFEQLMLGLFGETAQSPAPASVPHPRTSRLREPAVPGAGIPPSRGAPDAEPSVLAHPGATRAVLLGGLRVPYAFRRARRRTIGFVIGAEGLSVSAPRWVPLSEVEAALQEKSGWILRKLQEQHARNRRLDAARIAWAEGARVPFLGQSVCIGLDAARVRTPGAALLEVTRAADLAEAAERAQAAEKADVSTTRLWLGLPTDAAPERIRDAVHAWWQRQARRVFEERCAVYAPQLGVQLKRLLLSSAQTRWGSATAGGVVRLNWRLIQFPLSTIDYVVVHELAHLREMNHSAAFWEVVRSVLPEFEQAQAPLKQAVPLGD